MYPLKLKSDTFSIFQKFVSLMENQTGQKLKDLRSDNGGEYMSKAFEDFCDAKGIKRELSTPYTPSQNDTAEQIKRTIQEKVCSMLSHAALPHSFWAEAVKTAIHIVNRSPNMRLGGKVPEQVW